MNEGKNKLLSVILSKERAGFLEFEIVTAREISAWERASERARQRQRNWKPREDAFVASVSPPVRPASWSNKASGEAEWKAGDRALYADCRNCTTRSRPSADECAPFYRPHFPPFSCFSTWWVAGRKDTVSDANPSTIPTTLWRYEWPAHVGGITSASSPSSSIP